MEAWIFPDNVISASVLANETALPFTTDILRGFTPTSPVAQR